MFLRGWQTKLVHKGLSRAWAAWHLHCRMEAQRGWVAAACAERDKAVQAQRGLTAKATEELAFRKAQLRDLRLKWGVAVWAGRAAEIRVRLTPTVRANWLPLFRCADMPLRLPPRRAGDGRSNAAFRRSAAAGPSAGQSAAAAVVTAPIASLVGLEWRMQSRWSHRHCRRGRGRGRGRHACATGVPLAVEAARILSGSIGSCSARQASAAHGPTRCTATGGHGGPCRGGRNPQDGAAALAPEVPAKGGSGGRHRPQGSCQRSVCGGIAAGGCGSTVAPSMGWGACRE
jgi:hypothetical protein